MFLGRGREFGHMGERMKLISRFVHGQMTICAEAEDANIDRAIFAQPIADAGALFFRESDIRASADVAILRNFQRPQQVRLQIKLTGTGIIHSQAAPLVELENPKLLKSRRFSPKLLGEQLVDASGAGAGGSTEKEAGVGAQLRDNHFRGGTAEALIIGKAAEHNSALVRRIHRAILQISNKPATEKPLGAFQAMSSAMGVGPIESSEMGIVTQLNSGRLQRI